MRKEETENTFRLLFEQSTDAMLLLDEDVFIDCNPAAVEMFGCSDKKQLLSFHPSDFSPEKQPDGSLSHEQEKERITKAIEQGSNRFEWLHQRINGEVFPAEVLLTSIPVIEKKVVHVTLKDISERKQEQNALKESEDNYRTLAPSGHNTQPWKFSIEENSIRIFPDFSRQLPVVDPHHRELYISLGCALENLVIAARYSGYDSVVEYFPAGEPEECLLVNMKRFKSAEDNILFKAIPERHTNRREYNKQQIPTADLKKLEAVPKENGVNSLALTESGTIGQIIELVKEGNNIQMNDDAFMDELVSWIRFSDAEAEKFRDGLTSRAMGRSPAPSWLGRMFMNLFVNAKSQSKTDEKNIRSSSALMLLVSDNNDKKSWVSVGRSFERIALTLTTLNIKNAHLNQPCEVPQLKTQLQQQLALGSSHPQLLLRIGYSEPLPHSPRRKVEQVLI